MKGGFGDVPFVHIAAILATILNSIDELHVTTVG